MVSVRLTVAFWPTVRTIPSCVRDCNPDASSSRRYVSALRFGMTYWPASFEYASRREPVAAATAVTRARGTAAPAGSVTTPDNVAVVRCAMRGPGNISDSARQELVLDDMVR